MKNSTIFWLAAAIWLLWYFWPELKELWQGMNPMLRGLGILMLIFWEAITAIIRGECLDKGWRPSEEPVPEVGARYSVLYLIVRAVRGISRFLDGLPGF